MKILGISGSLRAGSYNTQLLAAAAGLCPQGVGLEICGCDLPLYNQDIDGDEKPPPVERFRAKVASADILLFATPEYNYSISGVLKNAIDWASRPAFKSPLTGKPAGMLSASLSPIGGNRAQAHLRQILAGTLTPLYPSVEMLVPSVHQAFDPSGALTDSNAERRLRRYLDGLVAWAKDQGSKAG